MVLRRFKTCRCPDDISAGSHAFRHNGDDRVLCPLPSQEQGVDIFAPELTGNGEAFGSVASRMPTGQHENIATEAAPVGGVSQESGNKVQSMEVEFQDDLFYDMFSSETCPHDDLVLPEDDVLPEFWQLDSSPSSTLHRGQLVKFDVQRVEQKLNEQPLRHTSSGAASRHRAPVPFTMQRSHSNTELAAMFAGESSEISRSNLRKSMSDSRLVDRATAPAAQLASHAKRSRRGLQ